jgi:non-ribosomal peptide synthetase component F
MQIAEPERALPAHTLIIGGEAAPPPLLEALRRQRRCRVINHYGPTESHVVTAHELQGEAAQWPDIPPIGCALPYVQLALLDAESGAPLADR